MRASSMSPRPVQIVDAAGQPVARGDLDVALRRLRAECPIEPGLYVAKFDDGGRWRIALTSTARANEYSISSLEPPPR